MFIYRLGFVVFTMHIFKTALSISFLTLTQVNCGFAVHETVIKIHLIEINQALQNEGYFLLIVL